MQAAERVRLVASRFVSLAYHKEYVALNQSFRGLANAVMKQSGKNLAAEKNLKVIVDLVEAHKAPDSRSVARSEDVRKFPGSFFETTAVQLEERVGRYKKTIGVSESNDELHLFPLETGD